MDLMAPLLIAPPSEEPTLLLGHLKPPWLHCEMTPQMRAAPQ